ncbi:hypothetical protein ACFS27_20305 [Promicromonospora vindobonensis]|uniref:Membrane protein DUF2207 n=1 Tax=Promicromonospora vindobonensis TaxID=195748 RepID=A0ABW5VXD1_9MICO
MAEAVAQVLGILGFGLELLNRRGARTLRRWASALRARSDAVLARATAIDDANRHRKVAQRVLDDVTDAEFVHGGSIENDPILGEPVTVTTELYRRAQDPPDLVPKGLATSIVDYQDVYDRITAYFFPTGTEQFASESPRGAELHSAVMKYVELRAATRTERSVRVGPAKAIGAAAGFSVLVLSPVVLLAFAERPHPLIVIGVVLVSLALATWITFEDREIRDATLFALLRTTARIVEALRSEVARRFAILLFGIGVVGVVFDTAGLIG